MEILQVLLSILSKGNGGEFLSGLLKLLQDNSFDIKKVLKNLDLSTVLPFIMSAFSNSTQKNSPTNSVGLGYGLNPITNIADKEIIYTLGRYFHQPLS